MSADRDSENGLRALGAVSWDAVVDVSRQPAQVRRAVRYLRTDHWVFVSSGNVYARFDRPEQKEDAPILEPLADDVMVDMSVYGAAKVACEEAVRMTSSATIARVGLIGGPGDWSGRSGYYPWRFSHPTGLDVLVPDDPSFPLALIDVDDLVAWLIHAAEDRLPGTFNVTGPTITLENLIAESRAVVGAHAPEPTWVPKDTLAAGGISGWMGPRSLPLWIEDPDWRWFATLDTTAARAHGLRTRPLAETLARTLAYEETRTEPRQTGLTDADEIALRRLLTLGC